MFVKTMSLTRIPSDVEKKICASSDIKSFTKAIEELVYNSFDAKSTSIAVRVFFQEGSIQVIDNGCGILQKDLTFLGHRYYTSKFNIDPQELQYGYRGTSLASIIEVSENVKITSRYDNEITKSTFTKTFIKGKEQGIIETSVRPSKGTTVNVSGFLYSLHIQKNTINPTTEISNVKTFLERISLVHCNTSISLRDDSKNEIIFQVNKHRDITQTLQTLYDIKPQDIQELQVEKNEYKIRGFIEKTNDSNRNYHYVYVNGRIIKNSKLQNTIDKMLKSNNYNRITKRKQIFDDTEKYTKSIPFYFIFIKCPQKDYHINYNYEETFIEFKNWSKIYKLAEKLIKFYKGDLKVTEINDNKNNNDVNKNTRKQVKQIMQRIIDNSAKRPKRLHLKKGIIGKNATRKDSKNTKKMSISKIVSKNLKSRFNGFYKNNTAIHKNDSESDKFISIERNKDIHLETKEDRNNYNIKQIINDSEQCKVKSNRLKVLQDPLNKKFENPTDSVLKRCSMFLKNLTGPNKVVDHTEYVASTVQTQIVVRFTNRQVAKKQTYIKTSHDLIKSVIDSGEVISFASSKDDKKDSRVKNSVRKNYKVQKYCNEKRSLRYSKESPPNKRKRFISEWSCGNFNISKSHYTISHSNEKHKKAPRNFSQEVKRNNIVDNFFHKKIYTKDSIQAIKTFESHFRNNSGSNFKSLRDRIYASNRFVHETLSSNIKTHKTSKIFTTNIENVTKYFDLHKTYTIEKENNNNNCTDEMQWKTFNKNNFYFSDVIIDNDSENTNLICQNMNATPFINCKNVFEDIVLDNSNIHNDHSQDIMHANVSTKNQFMQSFQIDKNQKGKNNINVDDTIVNTNYVNETNMVYIPEQNKAMNVLNIDASLFKTKRLEINAWKADLYDNNVSFHHSDKNSGKSCRSPNHYNIDQFCHRSITNKEVISLCLDNTTVTEYNFNACNGTKNVSLLEQLEAANPISLCDTVFQNNPLENNVFDFDKNMSFQDNFNFSPIKNIDCDKSFQCSKNIEHNDLRLDTIETDTNANNMDAEKKKHTVTSPLLNRDCSTPIDNEGFKINSRHSFIPKGMSQIAEIQYPIVPKFGEIEGNYYDTDIYDNFATHLLTFSEVLEPGAQILNDLDIKGIRHVNKPTSSDPIFDDQSLKEAKILDQVDNKFIGAKVTGRYARPNLTSDFLVLFDQHAIDERIRLENNLADYFDGDTWSSVLIGTVPIKLPKDIITYLHNFKDKFTRFGLEWAYNGDVITIKSIPKAILGKHFRQIDVILKAVKSLILEEVEAMKSLKGNVSLHPKSIMDLVLSEACRYAIKFGDKLRKSECEELLKAVSTCKLPFQCAHGRPVMAVMMELPTCSYDYKINIESLKRMKQKLAKYSK